MLLDMSVISLAVADVNWTDRFFSESFTSETSLSKFISLFNLLPAASNLRVASVNFFSPVDKDAFNSTSSSEFNEMSIE